MLEHAELLIKLAEEKKCSGSYQEAFSYLYAAAEKRIEICKKSKDTALVKRLRAELPALLDKVLFSWLL